MAKKSHSEVFSTVFVEIGSNWFKIIEADHSAKGLVVSKAHLEKFDTAGSALSSAIASAFKKKKFSNIPVISCIPRQMVNVRMLDLPSTDADEIADMVGFQAGKQTPYSRDEIAFDYKVQASTRDGYTKVLLAIVQRSVLRQRYSILEEAGIDIARMSVSSEGVLNWFGVAVAHEQNAPGATVIVDIDSTYSDFMVISMGAPIYTRSILIGADQLQGSFDSIKEEFVEELKRSLDICRGESQDIDIGTMLLTGAAPNVGGLSEYLSTQMGLAVKNRDCIHDVKKMPAQPSLSDPAYSTVSMVPVIGLAFAPEKLELNLVPDSVKLRKGLVEKARTLTAFGIVLMLLMLSLSSLLAAKIFYREAKYKVLQTMFQETEAPAIEVKRQKEIIDVVVRRNKPKFAAINILSAIHASIPKGTLLEEINIDSANAVVKLTCSSLERDHMRDLISSLESSDLFISVKSGRRSKDQKTNRHVFDVTCLLEVKDDA